MRPVRRGRDARMMSDVSEDRLERALVSLANRVEVSARRLFLDTGSVRATVPMLRGVWGKALRSLDRRAYERVFAGHRKTVATASSGVERNPLYVMRPAPADPAISPALDWIVIGAAREFEEVLVHAWSVAGDFGLGARREPFRIRATHRLGPDEGTLSRSLYWRLSEACLSEGSKRPAPCTLRFIAPLRILRKGKLIHSPTFVDVAVATFRRLLLLAGEAVPSSTSLARSVREVAAATPAEPWIGDRIAFVRWSASQQKELTLRSVSGYLHLPEGPGCLQALLDVARWIHVGKGTPFGLGQLCVEPEPVEHTGDR